MITGKVDLDPLKYWDRFRQWRELRRNVHAVVRLLYLEALKNYELLKCIKLEPGKVRQDDADYFAVIEQLDTSIMEFIFLEGEKSSKIVDILANKSRIVREKGEDEDGEEDIKLIHVVIFVYLKIDVLKKLAAMATDTGGGPPRASKERALKAVRYKTRLANVKSNLAEIIETLEKQKEFRKIRMRRFVGY